MEFCCVYRTRNEFSPVEQVSNSIRDQLVNVFVVVLLLCSWAHPSLQVGTDISVAHSGLRPLVPLFLVAWTESSVTVKASQQGGHFQAVPAGFLCLATEVYNVFSYRILSSCSGWWPRENIESRNCFESLWSLPQQQLRSKYPTPCTGSFV